MMKKQKLLKPCFVFLLFFTFSMLVIGCGENGESKVQTGKVEGRQLMKENGLLEANKAEAVVINTSGSEASQAFPIDDEIHLDEWIQLVKDIKSTLGEMDDESKQVLQTRGPR